MSEGLLNCAEPFSRRQKFNSRDDVVSHLLFDGGGVGAPLVSIMIPTFRRPELLRYAIKTALQQDTSLDYEVVVVDNEQDSIVAQRVDAVVSEFNSPKLRLYRNSQNLGMFGNWNRCIKLARGGWFTILNDDDFLLPFFLQEFELLSVEVENPQLIQLGYLNYDMRHSKAPPIIKQRPKKIRELSPCELLYGNKRAGSLGVFYKTDQALSIGGFDVGCYPVADLYFYFNYMKCFFGAYESNRVACGYRIFENESQRPEVLAGFVGGEYKLRRYLCENGRFSRLSSFYSNLVLNSHIYNLEKAWGVELDRDLVKSLSGAPGLAFRMPVTLARILGRCFRVLMPPSLFGSTER